MKKSFRNILLSALTVAFVSSCLKDDRNSLLPDDSFGFNHTKNDAVVNWPIYSGSYEFAVIKSGKGFSEADASVTGSEFALEKFNAGRDEMEKEYLSISKDSYDFDGASECSIHFGAEDVTKNVIVNWDVAKVDAQMSDIVKYNYAIPISLASEDLSVKESRDFIIINLVKSTLNVETSLLSETLLWEDGAVPVKKNMDVTIRIDNSLPTIPVHINLEIDESLVSLFNEQNGTHYVSAPAGLVSFENPVLEKGKSYVTFPILLNTEVLFENGSIVPWKEHDGFLAPVRVSKTDVERLGLKNDVTYVLIKGMYPVPPQLFNRNWAMYATSSENAWQTGLGISDARNITMNDEFIFVPQNAGGDPVLKAISIADPTKVKDVNVEGVSGGTHTLSCVRMIPNDDPEVNGGKDILVASNLTTGSHENLHYYVWLNGIDKAPTRFVNDGAGRRIGDKFEVYGTWAKGEVYSKDFNSGNIIRHGITGKSIGEWAGADGIHWARGRFDYNASCNDANSIGAAYMYPGTAGLGSGVPPYLFVTSSQFGQYYTHTNDIIFGSPVDLSLKMTYGYNFFSYEGRHYIAFVVLDESKAKGSVRIILDRTGTPEGLLDALQAQEVVMELPIQSEFDVTVESPYPSTHSTADCVVRKVGDKIYMAAMIQNVGLSLFEINPDFKAE